MKDHSFVELSHYSNQVCDVCHKALPWMALGSKPVECKREEGFEGKGRGRGGEGGEGEGEGRGGEGRGEGEGRGGHVT